MPDEIKIGEETASSPEPKGPVADASDPYFDPSDDELADAPAASEEAVEPETEKETPVVDAKAAIDADLIEKAMKAGLTKEDAESLGSSESLKRVMAAFEKTAETEKPTAFQKFEIPKLDPEVFEPAIIDAFDKLNEHYHDTFSAMQAQIEKMRDQMTGVAGELGKELQTAEQRRVSGYFEGLGKEWKDVFGGKEAQANRAKVTDEMKVIEAGMKAMGKTVPNETELFKRAVNGVFAEQLSQITKQKLSSSARDKSGQFLSKPTHRNGSALNSTQRAVMAVAALQGQGREIGLDNELEDSFS